MVGINTILTDDDWQPVARPVISGIPLEVQFTTVGVPTALADFTVADADSNLLTVSLASTNGTLDNLVDADVGTPGTQLSGTAAIINAAIAGAGFTVTAAGAADIRVSVHDGDVLNPVTRSYNLFAGERTLQGSPQGDILTGGSSADILNGAGGNDILIGGGGGDRLDGGEGDDYAGYTGSSGVFAHLTWAVNNSGDAAGDTYVGIEGLIGSGHDDLLAGNEANNTLVGNAGNDWLFGREGLDYLLGGEGNDVLSGGPGNDLLDGGAGDDVAYYGDAAPTTYYVSLHGFKTGMDNGRTYGISLDLGNPINNFGEAAFDQLVNIENLWGSPFDDIIRGADDVGGQAYGFGGNDYLFGGGGADVLDGGTGDDTLDLTRHVGLAVDTAAGGAGADRFVLDGNSRAVITDFATGVGGDTLDLNAALASSTDYSGGNPFDAALVYFRVAQDGANALMQWDSDGAAGAANWVTLATIQNTDAVAASQSTSLDITPPTLIGLSPPDGSTSVAAESNFYLTFDEPVVAGSGNIVIYNADGTVAQTIAVTDSTQVAAHGNTVIINPGSNLTDGRSYYINVDAGAVQDLVGQRFAGFSDASTFNFSVYGDDFANRVTDTSHPFGVLPVGSSASGDIGIAGDIDLFRVDLDAWLTYTFELKGASTGSGTLYDPYLRLLNSTGDLLASDDDSGFALDSLLTAAVVTSGTYYLDVRHFSNGTGTYVLSVVRDGITLDGTSADDLLNGGTGNDQLRGLAGNDTLNGGPGADQLTGGVGADVLTGGAGADSFFYLSHNDHLNASGVLELWDGGDTITDFQHGVDHIVVSRYWFGFGNIGGPAAALTTQHADFITNGSAPTQARPTFTYDAATSQLHFDGDGSGATAAVLMATLQAGATFTLSDIWTA